MTRACTHTRPVHHTCYTWLRASESQSRRTKRSETHVVTRQHVGTDGLFGAISQVAGRVQPATSCRDIPVHKVKRCHLMAANMCVNVEACALKERRASSECWSWSPSPASSGKNTSPHRPISSCRLGHTSGPQQRPAWGRPASQVGMKGRCLKGGARDMHDHCMAMQKTFTLVCSRALRPWTWTCL